MSALHQATLTQLAAGLKRRQFSSVELVRALLARIEAAQGALNSFISVTREQALAAAVDADRTLAQGEGGTPVCAPPAARACWRTSSRPTTPPWWRD